MTTLSLDLLPQEAGFVPRPTRLPGGTVVLVRELRRDDAARLHRLYHRLSPATVYRRFMTASLKPSERVLAYLTDLDHLDREALVATSAGEIVAVARYHRLAGTDEAELAVVVEDAWQRLGVGSALVTQLSALALARGIEAFTGSMLADNEGARRLLVSLFPASERRIHQGELLFRVPLSRRLADRRR